MSRELLLVVLGLNVLEFQASGNDASFQSLLVNNDSHSVHQYSDLRAKRPSDGPDSIQQHEQYDLPSGDAALGQVGKKGGGFFEAFFRAATGDEHRDNILEQLGSNH